MRRAIPSFRSSRSACRRGSCARRACCRCARTTRKSRSRWPIRPTSTRSARSRWSPAAPCGRWSRFPSELEAALERLVRHRQVGAEPGDRRRRDARRRPRVRRRRAAAEGPGLGSAGDPAREPRHHQRARHARLRHPRRAVRESPRGALPRRRRAARRRVAAQAPRRRRDLAHQDHGQPRHRRAPPAAGRPHPPARAGQGDRPARVDGADDARRVGGDADPRQGRGGARLPQAGLRGGHARRRSSTS